MASSVPPDLLVLAPWDAARLLETPGAPQTVALGSGAWQQLLPANPKRWALFLSTTGSGSSGFNLLWALATVMPTGGGVPMVNATSQLFTYPIYGPLTTLPLWVQPNGSSISALYQEFTVSGWTDQLEDVMTLSAQGKPVPGKLPPAPSVNGRQSVRDYWNSIISKVLGRP